MRRVEVPVNTSSPWVQTRLSGLEASSPVSFRVAAMLFGCDAPVVWSHNVTVTTSAASPPSPPTSLQLVHATGGAVQVSWLPHSDDGGEPASRFHVLVFDPRSDSSVSLVVRSTATEKVAATVNALLALTEYQVQVAAENSAGTSDFCPALTLHTLAVSKPSPPLNLTGNSTSGGSIRIGWSGVADTGGVTTLDFIVYKVGSSSEACSTAGLSCLVTGLQASTTYDFVVVSLHATEMSAPSETVSATTTTASSPGDVAAPHLVEQQSDCSRFSPLQPPCNPSGGAIEVQLGGTLDSGGLPIQMFGLQQWFPFQKTWRNVYTGESNTTTVSGLEPELTFQFRQLVKTAVGWSDPSPSMEASTTAASKPSVPRNVQISTTTGGAFCVSWITPIDSGGVALSSFHAYISTQAAQPSQCISPSDDSCTRLGAIPVKDNTACFGQLEPMSVYRFRLAASNVIGVGPLSPEVFISTTAATAPQAPSVPVELNVKAASVDVSWTPPVDTGGGTPVSFEAVVVPRPEHGASLLTLPFCWTGCKLHVDSLQSDKWYNISIRLITSANDGSRLEGQWSEAVSMLTRTTADPGYSTFVIAETTLLESTDSGIIHEIAISRLGGVFGDSTGWVRVQAFQHVDANGNVATSEASKIELVGWGGITSRTGVLYSIASGTNGTTVGITLQNDDTFQSDEHVVVCLDRMGSQVSGPSIDCMTVNIIDDGDAGVVFLAVNGTQRVAAIEGQGSVDVEVVRYTK